MTEHEDDEFDVEDREAPDPSDRNDDPAEVLCPYCKREISEDSPQCPYCGYYISAEDAPPSRKPWWWVLAVVVLIWVLVRYLWR